MRHFTPLLILKDGCPNLYIRNECSLGRIVSTISDRYCLKFLLFEYIFLIIKYLSFEFLLSPIVECATRHGCRTYKIKNVIEAIIYKGVLSPYLVCKSSQVGMPTGLKRTSNNSRLSN